MKAHIGVDAESGLVHTVAGTPANVADITKADDLLHGAESMAFGDAGYTGIDKRPDRKHTAECQFASNRDPLFAPNRDPSGRSGMGLSP